MRFSTRRIVVLSFGILFLFGLHLLSIDSLLAKTAVIDGVTYNIPTQVVASETFTFTYTYINDRPYGDFTAISMVDKIPDGTIFVSGGTFNATTREVTIASGPLAKGATVTFTYAVQVPENLAGTTLKTENVVFQIVVPGYELISSRLPFSQEITVIQKRIDTSTPTPSTVEIKAFKRTYSPGVVSPGEIITYTFRLANEGAATITQIIDLEVPIPTETVYKSGGVYDSGKNRVTYPNVLNLAPGAAVTLTLSVEVPQNTALGTAISAPSLSAWYAKNGSLYSVGGIVPGKTSVVALGTVLATYKNAQGIAFNPEIHGYGFQNFGQHTGSADDLGPADVYDLFGPRACTNSNPTRTNCQLSAAGTQWIKTELSGMTGGHCEGMAVTSQRLFEVLPFNGLTTPNDFQAGRTQTYALTLPGQSVENYIASYFVRQGFSQVSSEAYQSRNTMTPGQIVDKLVEEFNKTPSVGYALGIYKPGYQAGHAVTPYAVERIGATEEYRIVVYDNNFPGQKRYITVNKATHKWSYMAAADPTQAASLYEGDAGTKTLEINRISLRDMPAGQYFACKFCTSQLSASAAVSDTIEIGFNGEGKIQIVDDQGQRVGYDFDTNSEVNEISGTDITPVKNGLGLDIPPLYTVPYPQSDVLYQLYVGGATAESVTSGDLTITGPDFVMGVDGIALDVDQLLRFDISPDGNEIYFEATQDTIAPSLFMAFDPVGDNDPGLIIEIDGMLLKDGEVVYIGVDADQERVYFVSTADTIPLLERRFFLTVTDIWPDGGEYSNTYTVVLPKATRSAYLDYGNWTEGDAAPIVVEAAPIYLPAIQR